MTAGEAQRVSGEPTARDGVRYANGDATAPAPASSTDERSVLSLDVFDTLLVRSCGDPEALFLWLGRRLARKGMLPCTPEVFARARLRAERTVWDREGGPDARVTLRDFYDELARTLRLDLDLVDDLVAEELAVEERVLRPAPGADALLRGATSVDRRVVFTSDTYFPETFIRGRLDAYGLWPEGARCFSSSDAGASKATGALFRLVARDLDVPPEAIEHVGDNLECDVRAAARAGVAARWLPEARPNRYERLLLDARWGSAGMSAAFAGASRIARGRVRVATVRERALRDVAAGVGGPFLVSYVLWLLHRARELDLDRLYFAARDGQVLAEVADRIVRRLGWRLDVRYLYASRRSINLAAVYEAAPDELEWACRAAETIPLGAVLRRVGLELRDVQPALAELGFASCDEDAVVAGPLRAAVRTVLASDTGREAILASARERRHLVVDYLRQEGLLDGTRAAIVDIGGVGSQARALHELCIREGGAAPHFFFIGLDAYPDPSQAAICEGGAWLARTDCFLFDQQQRRGLRPFRGLVTGVHLFCAADHGTVLGYVRSDGRVAPVLDGPRDGDVIAWGLPLVRRTLREFADALVLDDDLVDPGADLREAACDVVRAFVRRPTPEEARAWGSLPFEGSEVSATTRKPLAEPYTWRGVISAVARGGALRGSFPDLSWNSWHEGALAMSPRVLRGALGRVERSYLQVRGSSDPRARMIMRVARWARARTR